MAERLNGITYHLWGLLTPRDPAADADLLARFADRRDEEAFATLVRRHGPMVMGVCRRVIRDVHGAEDAFQATFVVLARKARSLRRCPVLAAWLYGVAYRTALEARRAAAVRRVKERAAEMRVEAAESHDGSPELRDVLDRELALLPEVYRAAIVLCDLEGLPRKEAAVRLGWTEGTLSGRLFRGRSLLAARLSKYGLTVTAAALMEVSRGAAAGVPPVLAAATARAGVLVAAGESAAIVASAQVAALTEGVMRAMLLTKLKGMTAGLMVACAVTATGVAGWGVAPADAQERPAAPRDPDKDRIAQLEQERQDLLKLYLLTAAANPTDRIAQLERERDELLKLVAELKAKLADLEAGRKSLEPKTEVLPDRRLSVDPTSPPLGVANPFDPNSVPPTAKPGTPRPEGRPNVSFPMGGRQPRTADGMAIKVYAVDGLATDERQAEAVVRILKAAVDPASWQGGGAVVEYYPQGQALIVRQTADGHKQVGEVLDLLRSAAKPTGRTAPADEGNPRRSGGPAKR